jgi:hypothetical protein
VKRLRKFLKLSRQDQLLLIHATIVLAAVVVGLRLFPWRTLQGRLVRQGLRASRFGATRRRHAQQIARAVRIASSCIPKATCLPRALAAQYLLIRNAYPAELQVGVAKNAEQKLDAHAWVTIGSDIVIGGVDDLKHFVPLSPMKREDSVDYAGTS